MGQFCDDSMDDMMSGSRGSKQKEEISGTKKLIKTTIKSKAYLTKLLNQLSLPNVFMGTIVVSLLCMVVAITIAVVEYAVLIDLFGKIESQMQIFNLQVGSLSDIFNLHHGFCKQFPTISIAFFLVNRKMVTLNDTYPGYGNMTNIDFLNWTNNQISTILNNFNNKLIERRNIAYASIMDDIYSQYTTYIYNESGTNYTDVYIEMAYLLVKFRILKFRS